ncbi:MAG: PAS domain-containing sensor histidine kinase, partial [Rickettsiales bacterium]|nr:PAS domain-containing sensor histidine kinase [Rickettsiales bacterium]
AFKGLMHPDDVARCYQNYIQYVRREASSYLNEFRLRHKNGSWCWILSRGVGLWNSSGFMYRLVGSHTDITVQKEREEELKQLNADMEGFTYIASHDLRAPLVNLRGFASEVRYALDDVQPLIGKAKEKLDEQDRTKLESVLETEVPESLAFIDAAVLRMDQLTTAILDMSRIGRREYRVEEVDSAAVVQRCLSVLGHEIAAKAITVRCEPLPLVLTDALALEQVFGNLLDNAVKYLDPSRPGEINVQARQTLDDTVFSVADNGRGISEADRRKVFEIFRRAGNSGDVRGSGMGMAYVKAILRKLGGRIWFDSTVSQGTIFYFTIPRRTT